MLADSDAEALAIGRRAYKRLARQLHGLWRKHDTAPTKVSGPAKSTRSGTGAAPSSARRRRAQNVADAACETGANYTVCQFAFGDMSIAESLGSVDLFARL